MSQVIQQQVSLQGPAGELEAVLEHAPEPSFIALVCHPHPLFGGTMDNKVVTTLCRAVREGGGAALRFNFRGVGHSQGAYSEGLGETEDLVAALHWLQAQFPDRPLWLAGFSFGAFVAARGAEVLHANGTPAMHLLLVAPPVTNFDLASISDTGCPVTVVQGDDDEVVEAAAVHRFVATSPLAPELIRFPDCGHFFHGRLTDLKALAKSRLPGALAR